MLGAAADLPEHCREGYAAGVGGTDLPAADGVTAVTFCGMGGSAVAGDVLRVLYRERLRLPVEVVRGPALPAYCGPHTLVVCSSYSGETAETLSCFEQAVERGARLVCLTSGGTLRRRAGVVRGGLVVVPGGFQPRAALGFLALGLLGALEAMGIIPRLSEDVEEAVDEMETLAARLGPSFPRAGNPAKDLALAIGERVPVVWGADGIGSLAAMRWKTQLNENAKVPAWWSSLPELDHNEVAGWSGSAGKGFFLVALRYEGEHAQVQPRFPLSIAIAEGAGIDVEEVWAAGRSGLAKLLSLVMMGDFTSIYLGLSRGVDPTPVEVITGLKAALAER
jgi:glucose/mannose-6-phosphate isomerase